MKTKQRKLLKSRLVGGPKDGALVWQAWGFDAERPRMLDGTFVPGSYCMVCMDGTISGIRCIGICMVHRSCGDYKKIPYRCCVWVKAPISVINNDGKDVFKKMTFPEITFQ